MILHSKGYMLGLCLNDLRKGNSLHALTYACLVHCVGELRRQQCVKVDA